MSLTKPQNKYLYLLQISATGHPQHFSLELLSQSLHITQSDGLYSLGGALSLPDPVHGLYSLTVDVAMTTLMTSVTFNPHECDGNDSCTVTLSAPENATELNLDGALYVGGVTDVTAYMRSKLTTVEGFTGCLGVSHQARRLPGLD